MDNKTDDTRQPEPESLDALRAKVVAEFAAQPPAEPTEPAPEATPETEPETVPEPVNEPAAEPGAEPRARKWSKTITAPDGTTRTFTADTKDALIEQLVEAQQRLVNKHFAQRELKPSQPAKLPESRQLTPEELFDLSQQLGTDPSAAVTKVIESQFGMSLDQIKAQLVRAENLERAINEKAQAEAFVRAHPEYIVSAENGKRLMRLLQLKGLAPTYDNFEAVYQELKQDGLLRLKDPADPTSVPGGQPAASVAAAPARPPVRTGIPATSGANAPTTREETQADLAKLSARELRSRLAREFSAGRVQYR